jgi:uncharacterized protein YjiS (DUF1127 family)
MASSFAWEETSSLKRGFQMTHIATHTDQTGFLARLGQWFTAAIETPNLHLSRRAQIEALQGKSDEELSAMGIKRDQIAYHVYNDLFYA